MKKPKYSYETLRQMNRESFEFDSEKRNLIVKTLNEIEFDIQTMQTLKRTVEYKIQDLRSIIDGFQKEQDAITN